MIKKNNLHSLDKEMSSVPITIYDCKILFIFVFRDGVHGLSVVNKICPVGLNKSEDKSINKTTFTVRSDRVYFNVS